MTRTRSSPTAGFVTVRYLTAVLGLIFLVAVLFFAMDIRHRVVGYDAVSRSGIKGLATLTQCEWHRTGSFCIGDFVSTDGRVRRSTIRINGAAAVLNWDETRGDRPLPAGTKVRAVLSGPAATEAWASDATPWAEFSALHGYMLVPVALGAVLGWRAVRGGARGWRLRRTRVQRRRLRRDRRRLRLSQRRTHRGQVY